MSPAEFDRLKASEPALMLYFHNDTCSVCKVLWPKVSKVFDEEFPKIKTIRVYSPDSRELAGQLQMLSVPGIIIFFEGREYFRGNGMISIAELHSKTIRPYEMMFVD